MPSSTLGPLTIWPSSSTVERGIEAPCVPGSTPGEATKIRTVGGEVTQRTANPFRLVRVQYGAPISAYGGMVDAVASKAAARKGVLVRV